MDLNVDNIINLLKKLSYSNKMEFAEQDASADTSSSDTSSGTVKKWESGRTFGKTYMNDPKHKWYSGVQRGKANPATES